MFSSKNKSLYSGPSSASSLVHQVAPPRLHSISGDWISFERLDGSPLGGEASGTDLLRCGDRRSPPLWIEIDDFLGEIERSSTKEIDDLLWKSRSPS
ncbi:hypothetical protein LWI29_029029 [Acer saccharum]|uniref:Uncharacterized protein n=1 Tax=Acer saccharum TaxID=4024 RepID=A0AA39W792_ACESA|nr:hypothetical protein LWI29_029029 [Acer saccharum]